MRFLYFFACGFFIVIDSKVEATMAGLPHDKERNAGYVSAHEKRKEILIKITQIEILSQQAITADNTARIDYLEKFYNENKSVFHFLSELKQSHNIFTREPSNLKKIVQLYEATQDFYAVLLSVFTYENVYTQNFTTFLFAYVTGVSFQTSKDLLFANKFKLRDFHQTTITINKRIPPLPVHDQKNFIALLKFIKSKENLCCLNFLLTHVHPDAFEPIPIGPAQMPSFFYYL